MAKMPKQTESVVGVDEVTATTSATNNTCTNTTATTSSSSTCTTTTHVTTATSSTIGRSIIFHYLLKFFLQSLFLPMNMWLITLPPHIHNYLPILFKSHTPHRNHLPTLLKTKAKHLDNQLAFDFLAILLVLPEVFKPAGIMNMSGWNTPLNEMLPFVSPAASLE